MVTDMVGACLLGTDTRLTTHLLGHLGQASQPLQASDFVILKQ